jgi:hypothetical protein
VNTLSLASHPFGRAFDRAQELAVERLFSPVPWRILKWLRTKDERELSSCCRVYSRAYYIICLYIHDGDNHT